MINQTLSFPCPKCQGDTGVKQSFSRKDGHKRRNRRCRTCRYEFITVELPGSPEQFQREPNPREQQAEIIAKRMLAKRIGFSVRQHPKLRQGIENARRRMGL